MAKDGFWGFKLDDIRIWWEYYEIVAIRGGIQTAHNLYNNI